jgi:HEAT repeat protein
MASLDRRRYAPEAMRTPRSEIPRWLALTRSADRDDRRKAVQALCPCETKVHAPLVWQRMLEMADDPDARVRRSIMHVLCDGSPAAYEREIVRVLESRYHDPDERVRKAARKVLAGYRRSGALNVL